jgi:hypothetical protein
MPTTSAAGVTDEGIYDAVAALTRAGALLIAGLGLLGAALPHLA